MEINIITIPHKSQRYDTCGDYELDKTTNVLDISISDMKNEDYEFLVGIHEAIEAYLCHKRKISFDKITKFDIAFEKNRKEGNIDEPGDDPKAPYHREHIFATKIEKLLAKELKVDWKKYDKTVSSL